MRILLILFLLVQPIISNSQIIIDQAGDNWKALADSAVKLIKITSPHHYLMLANNCERITFFTADYSSISGELGEMCTIYISRNDVNLGIQNIAVAIVHESFHCKITHENKVKLNMDYEELCAYLSELSFLNLLPAANPMLIRHAQSQINNLTK
jgi:hypothetical protein